MSQRKIEVFALAKDVLAVAVEGGCNDWTAYIGAVPGNNHRVEYLKVRDHGSKLPQKIAEILFPNFKHLTWRD